MSVAGEQRHIEIIDGETNVLTVLVPYYMSLVIRALAWFVSNVSETVCEAPVRIPGYHYANACRTYLQSRQLDVSVVW